MKTILGKFIEIQIEQNDLLKDIAREENLLQFWTASAERSSHLRDSHHHPWDPSIAVKEQQTITQELSGLHHRYKKNQERLEELRKQIFAAVL
jgi:hypothetical protein